MHRKTIPIVFHAGTYGTYLEWALTTLTTNIDVVNPVTKTGSSHLFKGNHLLGFDPGWKNYLQQPAVPFVRLHPKTHATESNNQIVAELFKTVDQVIYITPADNETVLCINNQYFKVRNNWWDFQFKYGIIDPELIYKNWPVSCTTPVSQIPAWIVREFLSFYLMPSWHSMTSWQPNSHCVQLNIKQDIFYNFENTINRIVKQCGLSLTKPISSIMDVHSVMVASQSYLTQDQLCNQIISSVLEQHDFDWGDQVLTLPSEVWIQWQLRNHQMEIRCDGLDIFPTNSVQLQQLLYSL